MQIRHINQDLERAWTKSSASFISCHEHRFKSLNHVAKLDGITFIYLFFFFLFFGNVHKNIKNKVYFSFLYLRTQRSVLWKGKMSNNCNVYTKKVNKSKINPFFFSWNSWQNCSQQLLSPLFFIKRALCQRCYDTLHRQVA